MSSGSDAATVPGGGGRQGARRRRRVLDVADLLQLQRAVGNRAVARLVGHPADGATAGRAVPSGQAVPSGRSVLAAGPTAAPSLEPTEEQWVGGAHPLVAGMRARANGMCDRLPRTTLRLGVGRLRTAQPSFRVAIWAAVAVATVTGALLAPAAGVATADFLRVVALALGLVVAVLLVHRLVAYALHATVLAGALAAVAALGLPVLPVMDVVAVGLAAGEAVGRMGCAMVGCCYGRPSRWGQRYGPEHVRFEFPARLVGVRLLPVQQIEAVGCAALVALGAVLLTRGAAAGATVSTVLVGYAALRFGLERLRGDTDRRWVGGLSEAQWTASAMCAGVLTLQVLGVLPLVGWHWIPGVGVLAAAARGVLRHRVGIRLASRLGEVAVWDDLALGLHTLASTPESALRGGLPGVGDAAVGAPAVASTALGLRVSSVRTASPLGPQCTYGISSRSGPLAGDDARRVADLVLRLRHPDAGGLLVRRAGGCHVLLVPPDGARPGGGFAGMVTGHEQEGAT